MLSTIDKEDYIAARECLQEAQEKAERIYVEALGQYYLEENKRLQKDPVAAVPEDVNRRGLELINRLFGPHE